MMKRVKCSVSGCSNHADYKVFLRSIGFYEKDNTCPFICDKHKKEDEQHDGELPLHTNKCLARCRTIYEKI